MSDELRVPSGYGFDWPPAADALMNMVDEYADEHAVQAGRTMSAPEWGEAHRLRARIASALNALLHPAPEESGDSVRLAVRQAEALDRIWEIAAGETDPDGSAVNPEGALETIAGIASDFDQGDVDAALAQPEPKGGA